MPLSLEEARGWFAEDLRVAAGIKSPEVIDAFARVPRERFIGHPPWHIGMRVGGMGAETFAYGIFEGDARLLYHDVVVALDKANEINNGQPSLWAKLFDELDLQPAARILHLGCGTGYYSAVLAEIVGPNGSVDAVEVDAQLAERASEALCAWPNVSVRCADGSESAPGRRDAIIVSAGLTHPLAGWLEGLAPEGRLLFPLTMDGPLPRSGNGAMLLVSRTERGSFAARFLGPAGFIHFRGGRDVDANAKLQGAFRKGIGELVKVRSLRRDEHPEDDGCWLHGRNFCLSRRDPE
ncbi:MAG TPA: methyltransferase domain-containing protein [Rhizomicrobium sp.]|jgi:protein-L-isoaspartate(D-aspartate) O-methyltransferase|nr:methyltransferase domain-containing protein [Rhizomicrobium sp.]